MTTPTFPTPARRIGREIEIYSTALDLGQIRHAVFDFDGTLSLIRAGWQEVMLAQCVGELEKTPTRESRAELEQVCRDFITRLTGQQTIFQMFCLEEEIAKRNGNPRPALEYKKEYLDLLLAKIRHRLEALRSGKEPPETYQVRGGVQLLENLLARGVTCYLASGTDHDYVLDEAALLGFTPYFKDRIYGAQDDYKAFSKKKLIARIIADNSLSGSALAVFGDGYVELENAKQAGGIAVGIASLESGEFGWDQWKKRRLLEVGADILVPDWQEATLLLGYLFDETTQ